MAKKFRIYRLSLDLHWYWSETTGDEEYAKWLVATWPETFRYEEIKEGLS